MIESNSNKILAKKSAAHALTSRAIIFLAQTDTTAGFLSQSQSALNAIKHRPLEQKILLTLSSSIYLHTLGRVPKMHRNMIRRAKKTSFILPNGKSFRIIRDQAHLAFLRHFGALYSTSANLSGKPFDRKWACAQADIVILDARGLYEHTPSTVYALRRTKLVRIR